VSQLSDLDRAGAMLRLGLDALGVGANDAAAGAVLRFAGLVLDWNRRTNLTGAADLPAFVSGPLFDALTLLAVLEGPGSLVDVGAGAGLPGIPAALLTPGLKVTLVEPRRQRAEFLAHVIEELSLDAEVSRCRAQALEPAGWDGAVAQAVWPPREWMPIAARLVLAGKAVYVLSTAPPAAGEIPAGLRLEVSKALERPFDGASRFAARLRSVG